MAITCPNCGAKNPNDAVFCAECGKVFENKQEFSSTQRNPSTTFPTLKDKKTLEKLRLLLILYVGLFVISLPIFYTMIKTEDYMYFGLFLIIILIMSMTKTYNLYSKAKKENK